MAFDRIQARKLVAAAESAYGRGIHSEFIGKIAAQLKEALESSDAMSLEVRDARNAATRFERELDEEKAAYRKLRERSAHTDACIALLKTIAASPKGAQKKAADFVASIGEAPAAAAPAAPIPEPTEIL